MNTNSKEYQRVREKFAKVFYSIGYSLDDWEISPHRKAYLAIAAQLLATEGIAVLADVQYSPVCPKCGLSTYNANFRRVV